MSPAKTHAPSVRPLEDRDPTVVNIPEQGVIQGFWDEERNVYRFLNVPYAVVTKRWRKASPVEPWNGIRDATRVGPMCPQTLPTKSSLLTKLFGIPTMGEEYEYSERDCLNLAIYAPTLQAIPKNGVPVMVIIHGGKLRYGGNAHPAFDASNIVHASIKANRPVIVVVMNYRLGYLGYFASHELAHEFDSDPENVLHGRSHDQDPDFGNWGLSDQKIALEWVRDHIGVFGGDPSRVTAMGHSAGGTSIMNHMLIPSHHGLFSQAIVHSAPLGMVAYTYAAFRYQKIFDHLCDFFWANETLPVSQRKSKAGDAKVLLHRAEMLRAIPAEDLMKAPEAHIVDDSFYHLLDNKYRFPNPESAVGKDISRYDPGIKSIIIGSTKDEAVLFTVTHGARTVRHWKPFLNRWVDPKLHLEVESIYGKPRTNSEARAISVKMIGDLYANHPLRSFCKGLFAQEGQERTVYRFYTDRTLEILNRLGLGPRAPHGIDMAFTMMADVHQQYMTKQEQSFGYRILERYFEFVYGTNSGLSLRRDESTPLEPRMIGCKPGDLANSVATVWAQDLTIQTEPFERMNARTIDLWRRNEEWAVKKRPHQPLGSVGAKVFRDEQPATTEFARL